MPGKLRALHSAFTYRVRTARSRHSFAVKELVTLLRYTMHWYGSMTVPFFCHILTLQWCAATARTASSHVAPATARARDVSNRMCQFTQFVNVFNDLASINML
jgi:hypothetical protein